MRERTAYLNVRISDDEREKLRALAIDRDLTASTLIRRFVREAHARRFGTAKKRAATRRGAR